VILPPAETLDPAWVGRAFQRREFRLHRPVSPTPIEALLTCVAVALTLEVALLVGSAVPTPARVAASFAEAVVTQDPGAVWPLLCRPMQTAAGSEDAFTARAEASWTSSRPRVVTASTRTAHRSRVDGAPALVVPVLVRSLDPEFEDWWDGEDVPVVLEREGFRVCHSLR
jgi:hypothetical protein